MRHKETYPETFVIPQLVPDDEPDDLIDRYASTNPGVAGFSYQRPSAQPVEQPSDRRTGREKSQRRQILEEFEAMGVEAERAAEERRAALAQQALHGIDHRY